MKYTTLDLYNTAKVLLVKDRIMGGNIESLRLIWKVKDDKVDYLFWTYGSYKYFKEILTELTYTEFLDLTHTCNGIRERLYQQSFERIVD